MAVRAGERYRDRYDVLERIGEGAFAQVWRARDVAAEREVALKVLKDPYLTVKDVVERFQREVFAVASIDSPHVVALFDFGISDDVFYLVTELLRGPSLRQLMGERPWTATDVYVIVGQVAHALKAAHGRGIVHRDLKPENIVLVEKPGGWQVKVIDFGFAQLPELERKLGLEPLTRKGHLFGTPQYLAPELIRGRAVEGDGGPDLFALGVVAYEMLAGKRPWDGEDPMQVMRDVLAHLPPAVTTLHETLSPRVEEINRFLDRALAKERGERPADASAFFEELGRALFPGAAPSINQRLDQVSSRSIELRVRRDATEVNLDDNATVPFMTGSDSQRQAVGNDTLKQTALDSSAIRVDGPSDIPIFVGAKEARSLPSSYLRRPDGVDEVRSERPYRPPVTPPERRAGGGALRALVYLLLTAAVAAGAFWLGRVWK